MDGTYITATRTAAGSALATRLLAREDARVLAISARACRHVARAGARARPEFDEIRVASARSRERRAARRRARPEGAAVSSCEEAIAWSRRRRGDDALRRARRSARVAVARASTSTPSGANPIGRGEVDAATIAETRSWRRVARVDARSASRRRAGVPRRSTRATCMRSSESWSRARRPGRTSPEQITLYKSVGVAVQDAAAAALVLAAARERSVGREIELGEST